MDSAESEAATADSAATQNPSDIKVEEPDSLCHLCEKIQPSSLASPEGYQHAASIEEADMCRRTCRLCWRIFNSNNLRDWATGSNITKGPVRVRWAPDSRICIDFLVPSHEAHTSVKFFVRRRDRNAADSSEISKIPITVEPPENSSEVAVSMAKAWLSDCARHHDCGKPLPFFDQEDGLPKRLLHIETSPGSVFLQVRLVETDDVGRRQDDSEQGPSRLKYFALSHCWGPDGLLDREKTTSSSLSDRQTGIDTQTLPLNFQHAIRITWNLGAEYLWIDALCIIQDSLSDWAQEGARMGAIYSNAYLTIAAASSDKANDGFLDSGPVPKLSTGRPGCFHPRRMLDGELDPLELWYNHIIPDFTTRGLTYNSDSLAAVSSVARAVAWKRGWPSTDYLAGLWCGDLGRGLAWKMRQFNAYERSRQRGDQDLQSPPDAKSEEWRSPSWSWISAKAQVDFEHGHGAFAEFEEDDPSQSSGALVKLVRSEITTGIDPFGPVRSTGIVVEAPICYTGLMMPDCVVGFLALNSGRTIFRKLGMVDLDVGAALPSSDAYPFGEDKTLYKITLMALYATYPSRSTAAAYRMFGPGSLSIDAYLLLPPSDIEGPEGMDYFQRIGFMSTPPSSEFRAERQVVMLV